MARIVSISQPEPWTGCSTVNELIAFCARVSNKANQQNHVTGSKLVKYLMGAKHWSPFEMVHVCLEVECTRDIGRQVLRHHSLRFQEYSQRYAEVSEDQLVPKQCRLQDPDNRQNSIQLDPSNLEHMELDTWWFEAQSQHAEDTMSLYNAALGRGIAKEQARGVLPEGMTNSTMYISGFLRDFIFYCSTRLHPSTQDEHMWLAEEIADAIITKVPTLGPLFASFIQPDTTMEDLIEQLAAKQTIIDNMSALLGLR